MKIILISKPSYTINEHQVLADLFELGLESFHIRKPKFSKKEIIRYLERIPYMYRNRLILHSFYDLAEEFGVKGVHFTDDKKGSFKKKVLEILKRKPLEKGIDYSSLQRSASLHSLNQLAACNENYDYVFLSPIFDSISKKRHKSLFKNKEKLRSTVLKSNQRVIALGGINAEKIKDAQGMGFSGVALLGAIWKQPDPVEAFLKIKEECELQTAQNFEMNVVQQTYRIKHSGT
ncbi:MAG: thiamine phosphate synthase [Bacteroidia bacterium]|nr:thiamine phosphate synthase [Bacteroidia bacterium]